MTIERPHLRDAKAEAAYEDQGYVVVPEVGRAAVRALRRVHRRLIGSPPPGFHATLYSDDTDQKRAVHEAVLAELLPVIDAVLRDHRPLLASFVTKARSGGRGRIGGHASPPGLDVRRRERGGAR